MGTRALMNYLRTKNLREVKSPRMRALIKRLRPKQTAERILPTTLQMTQASPKLLAQLKERITKGKPISVKAKRLMGRFGGRTVPLGLGSALAAYLGTKALTD